MKSLSNSLSLIIPLLALLALVAVTQGGNTWRSSRAVASTPATAALSGAATVRVQAPSDPLVAGDLFTVTLGMQGLSAPLSAFQFDLTYDPTVLTLRFAEEGPLLSATGRMVVCPTAAIASGTLRLACASTGAKAGPTGDGILAVLTFEAVQAGDSDLTLSDLQLADDNRPPSTLSANAESSQVSIESSLPTPTPNSSIYLPAVFR